MRLKTVAPEESTVVLSHTAPSTETRVAPTEGSTHTQTQVRSRKPAKTKKKTPKTVGHPRTVTLPRFRYVALALVGIFGFPWLPAKPVALEPLPPGSANQLYSDASQRMLALYTKRLSQYTPQDWKAWEDTHALRAGRAFPKHLEDPSGFTTVEEARANVTHFKKELATLQEGLKHRFYPEKQYQLSKLNFIGVRELARLSTRAGNLKQLEGDYGGALAHYLDTYALGVQQYQGKSFQSGMVGVLCEGIALASADHTVAHLTATQARSALQRLEPLVTARPTLAALIAYDKQTARVDLRYYAEPEAQEKLWGKIPAVQLANEFLLRRYEEAMGELERTVQQPLRRVLGRSETRELTWKNLDQLLAIQEVPYLGRATATYMWRTARANRLLLKLALRCWQLENQGGSPATLNQLVERGYLKTLPTDPYSLSGHDSFHYDAASGTVWSVGLDGVNNNGVGDDLIRTPFD